jgi:hypothetical protein
MSDGFAHATHLTVTTFVNHDAQDAWRWLRNFGWGCDTVFKFNSVSQTTNRTVVYFSSRYLSQIFLLDTMAWMSNAVSQLPVVGHQQ